MGGGVVVVVARRLLVIELRGGLDCGRRLAVVRERKDSSRHSSNRGAMATFRSGDLDQEGSRRR